MLLTDSLVMCFVLIVPLSSLVAFIGPPALDTSGSCYTVIMHNIWLYE